MINIFKKLFNKRARNNYSPTANDLKMMDCYLRCINTALQDWQYIQAGKTEETNGLLKDFKSIVLDSEPIYTAVVDFVKNNLDWVIPNSLCCNTELMLKRANSIFTTIINLGQKLPDNTQCNPEDKKTSQVLYRTTTALLEHILYI